MSNFVNGSLTKYFQVSKDPLFLFLFLTVAEGLAVWMHNVVAISEFQGFQLNDDTHFKLLQFADDMVLIGVGSCKDLWSTKASLFLGCGVGPCVIGLMFKSREISSLGWLCEFLFFSLRFVIIWSCIPCTLIIIQVSLACKKPILNH